MNVFVSCTTCDLGRFREVICDRPEEWWGTPRGVPRFHSMGDAKAEAIPPVDWSIREAALADVLVLLLGRYHGALADEPNPADCRVSIKKLRALARSVSGWDAVREPTRFSYTQWEVLSAVAARVPLLVFTPDSESADEDLRSVRGAAAGEEPWLELRQERFAAWVRDRFTEDHFKNRSDLMNRVRAGLRRVAARRRLWRGAALLAVAVVVLLAAALLAHWCGERQEHLRQEKEQNAARDAQVYQQRLAVAAGGALAMLGQDPTGASGSLFERAIQELGFPANQVNKLAQAYADLDRAVRSGLLTHNDFERRKSALRSTIRAQGNVLAGRDVPAYIDFGYELHRLLLLLRFWDRLAAQGDVAGTSEECLTALKDCLRDVAVDEHQAAVRELHASDFADITRRKAAIAVLDGVLRQFDMEPRRSTTPGTGPPSAK